MRVSSEFSKYASSYGTYNVIQSRVVAKLLADMKSQPRNILDLGCGEGAICKAITWEYEHFVGVDFAKGMLELHPKAQNIECIYGDFNDAALFEELSIRKFDYIFSSSALQWSEDLDVAFQNIKALNAPFSFAIFTSNTFKTLYETASLKPILKSADEIYNITKRYFDAEFEIVEYKLQFENTRDIFKYIKKSGVSASRRVLGYKNMKKLIGEYPADYLEFEVVFIRSR